MIRQLTKNVWAVPVPEDANEFEINFSGDRLVCWTGDEGHYDIDLPPGKWEFICTSKDATEEQAAKIVAFVQAYGYRNYLVEDYAGGSSPFDVWIPYSYKTPLESLQSLIKSKGLEGNYALLKKL